MVPAREGLAGNFTLTHQRQLKPFIQPADAKRPFAQRAEQLVLAEGGDNRVRFGMALHQREIVPIARQRVVNHLLIGFGTVERFPLDILKALAEDRLRGALITAVNRGGQLTDAGVAAEAVTFLQQAEAVTQRGSRLAFACGHFRAG